MKFEPGSRVRLTDSFPLNGHAIGLELAIPAGAAGVVIPHGGQDVADFVAVRFDPNALFLTPADVWVNTGRLERVLS